MAEDDRFFPEPDVQQLGLATEGDQNPYSVVVCLSQCRYDIFVMNKASIEEHQTARTLFSSARDGLLFSYEYCEQLIEEIMQDLAPLVRVGPEVL